MKHEIVLATNERTFLPERPPTYFNVHFIYSVKLPSKKIDKIIVNVGSKKFKKTM